MQPLKEANIGKCLDLLEDFHEAVPSDKGDRELMEKKEQARQALDQLGRILLKKADSSVKCDDENPK